MTSPVSRFFLYCALGSLPLSPAVAIAQDGATEGDDNPVFELSPFEVSTSKDMGYLAHNSVSGTRFAVPIRDLPMSLEVINVEQMTDQGATDFKSAIQYTAGVFTSSDAAGSGSGANAAQSRERSPSARAGVGGFTNNAISIRGFNTPFQLRNGFRIGGFIPSANINLGGITDAVSIERVEVVRGPQSLLYGLSVLSGIANIIPKRPMDEPRTQVKFTYGSYDFMRGELDVTGPTLVDGLNYRAFLASSRSDDRVDYRSSAKDYAGFQLEYQPNRALKLFAEVQYGDQLEEGIGPRTLRDNYNLDRNSNNWYFRNDFGEYVEWATDPNYGDMDPATVNLGGPDTYYDREEWNAMFDAELKPFKEHEFRIKTGVMLGTQDIERRYLVWRPRTGNNGTLNIHSGLGQGTIDPGVVTMFDPDPLLSSPDFSHAGDVDPYPMEPVPLEGSTFPEDNDYKTSNYWFELHPTEAENLQVRAELSYIVETGWLFGTNARHSFLLGRVDIQDEVDFIEGRSSYSDNVGWIDENGDSVPTPITRRNVLDFTPIRYAGQPYSPPGQDYRNIKVWFTGHYFAYNGTWFDEKLNVIVGARHDRYDTWEGIYDRVDWNAGGRVLNPEFDPYNPNRITGLNEERSPGYLFDEAQEEETFTFAVNYRINDQFSVFYMQAEGISPNTGLKDGNFDAIKAERTESSELGFKFELLDGKVSGSASAWIIERDNVIWRYDYAPRPGLWIGGDEYKTLDPVQQGLLETRGFDPEEARSYFINRKYLEQVGIRYENERNIIRDENGNVIDIEVIEKDERLGEFQKLTSNPDIGFAFVDYEQIMDSRDLPEGDPGRDLYEAFELAFNELYQLPEGLDWSAEADVPILYNWYDQGNNASLQTNNTNVTMSDESKGFDVNFVLTPIENWQWIINYSYIEREVTSGFQFASTDNSEGEPLGTAYDLWVYHLGRDAYADPTRPESMNSDFDGLSLFFSPQHTAKVWTKYTFQDGGLDGLSIGGGVRYRGEAQTSIPPIGSRDAILNPYRTPPAPERFIVDAMLAYNWEWKGADWRLQVNAYNLLDDTYDANIVTYERPDGTPTQRRTERFYTPTTMRVSLGVTF